MINYNLCVNLNGIEIILSSIPSYSFELGLNLKKSRDDRFKWFIASMLFAKRISSKIAIKTFRIFVERGLTNPKAILDAGWDFIVEVLDEGGYVRYDFSTATNIIENMKFLMEKYHGDIDNVNEYAFDERDLEARLMEFRGFGPTAINIFLRELRGVWSKAKPKPSKYALEIASKIGLSQNLIEEYESQLVRIFIEYCKRRFCNMCLVKRYCGERID